ncbi:MAG: MlaD family protein [Desulfomonilia bacterium]|jgi:phospholipid/cholesterol/gamma-HCH transport system substrate-binding protein
MSNEAKVGIFIVAVVAVFLALSYFIGELDLTRKKTYPVSMVFTTVEGLSKGSQIVLAGVQVGSVDAISLNPDYSALVAASIYENIRIPADSLASVATRGVLGDKVIVIQPGASEDMVEPGGKISRTNVPPSLDDLLLQLGELANNLTDLSYALNTTLGDEETLQAIMNNIRRFTEDSSELVAQNREDINAVISGLRRITDTLVEASEGFTTTGRELGEIARTINAGEGTIGRLVHDDELYVSLVEFMGTVQGLVDGMSQDGTLPMLMKDPALYANLVAISENVRTITGTMAEGEGTLGRLLTDQELYENLREALRNANLAAQGIEEQTPVSVFGTIMGLMR